MNAATSQQTPAALHSRFDALDSLRRYGITVVFAILVVTMMITSPQFRTKGNFLNLLQQNSIIGILACGMTFAIILGGFDLSVGANAAMCSVVAAKIMIEVDIGLGIVAALIAGLMVGLFNGVLIAYVGVNPFVSTLGTMTIIRGLVFVYTNATPLFGVSFSFTRVGLGRSLGVPNPFWIFAAVALVLGGSAWPDPVWSSHLCDRRQRCRRTANGHQCQANASRGLRDDRGVRRHIRDHPGRSDGNRSAGRRAQLRADGDCCGDHRRGDAERRLRKSRQHHRRRVPARALSRTRSTSLGSRPSGSLSRPVPFWSLPSPSIAPPPAARVWSDESRSGGCAARAIQHLCLIPTRALPRRIRRWCRRFRRTGPWR